MIDIDFVEDRYLINAYDLKYSLAEYEPEPILSLYFKVKIYRNNIQCFQF